MSSKTFIIIKPQLTFTTFVLPIKKALNSASYKGLES